MKAANSVLSGFGTTVFEVMSRLAMEYKSINLGQGFPDGGAPDDVIERAAHDVVEGWNQYPPMLGLPALRQAVARHGQRFYGLDVDWQTETMVTSGATEALAACLFALIEPGDEVVVIEPLYDSYIPIIRRAGGVPKFVTLTAPDWQFDAQDLDRAFSDKTKLVLLNNPQNPAAKVFTRDELALLAQYVDRFDAYAVCDEVYEHIAYAPSAHIPFISLPGMRERALKIGSAGKTFSLTGWKVGYITAAPALLQVVAKAHQFVVFTTPPNLQSAVAYGLDKDDTYFTGLTIDMQAKRDRLSDGLNRVGFQVLEAQGTYFVNADFSPLGFVGTDVDFCRWITTEAGVTAIPVSAFYASDVAVPRTTVRFCFAKQDTVLEEAVERLATTFAARKAAP